MFDEVVDATDEEVLKAALTMLVDHADTLNLLK